MAEARLDHDWDRASWIAAAVFNARRTSKKDPILQPDEINPRRMNERKPTQAMPGGIEALKVFLSPDDRRKGGRA